MANVPELIAASVRHCARRQLYEAFARIAAVRLENLAWASAGATSPNLTWQTCFCALHYDKLHTAGRHQWAQLPKAGANFPKALDGYGGPLVLADISYGKDAPPGQRRHAAVIETIEN